jgi:hypothetical protein
MNRSLQHRIDKVAEKVNAVTEPTLSCVVGQTPTGQLIISRDGHSEVLAEGFTEHDLRRLYPSKPFLIVNFDPRDVVSGPGDTPGDTVS